MEAALRSAVGGRLPIPQLLSIIAAYAQPFVSTVRTVCRLDAKPNRLWDVSVSDGGAGAAAGAGANELLFADGCDRLVRISLPVSSGTAAALNVPVSGRFTTLPVAAVRDPLYEAGYFVGDQSSISYLEVKSPLTLLTTPPPRAAMTDWIMGNDNGRDGIGTAVRFDDVTDFIISSNGREIWVLDAWQLRTIDVEERSLWTVGFGFVERMVWDRSPTAKPEAAIWLAGRGLFLHEIETGKCTEFLGETTGIDDIACTTIGLLLLNLSDGLNVYNPTNNQKQPVSAGKITSPVLIEPDRCVYFIWNDTSLMRLDLPPTCFPLPVCPCCLHSS